MLHGILKRMSKSKHCPFCDSRIIKQQSFHKTQYSIVLYNIHESTKGRCLIVPKRHVSTIKELKQVELNDLIQTVKFVSATFDTFFQPIGMNYGFNEGAKAGQTIDHFHFHLIPRFVDDPLPKYHLFHHDPKNRSIVSPQKLKKIVMQLQTYFSR